MNMCLLLNNSEVVGETEPETSAHSILHINRTRWSETVKQNSSYRLGCEDHEMLNSDFVHLH